jgi:hypothetical protein
VRTPSWSVLVADGGHRPPRAFRRTLAAILKSLFIFFDFHVSRGEISSIPVWPLVFFSRKKGHSCRTRKVWPNERGHDYEDIFLRNQPVFGRRIFGKTQAEATGWCELASFCFSKSTPQPTFQGVGFGIPTHPKQQTLGYRTYRCSSQLCLCA